MSSRVVIQGSRDDLISVGSTDSRRVSTLTEKDHGEFPSAHAAPEGEKKKKWDGEHHPQVRSG